MSETVNIGDAAEASGVSAKMIRHYEAIGLIGKASRTYSGYRMYAENDIHVLRFIRQARNFGFSIKQIVDLLALWKERRRSSAKVKALAFEHVKDLDERIAQMQVIKGTLEQLATHCHGDHRPDCPILDGIEGGRQASHANGQSRTTPRRAAKHAAGRPRRDGSP